MKSEKRHLVKTNWLVHMQSERPEVMEVDRGNIKSKSSSTDVFNTQHSTMPEIFLRSFWKAILLSVQKKYCLVRGEDNQVWLNILKNKKPWVLSQLLLNTPGLDLLVRHYCNILKGEVVGCCADGSQIEKMVIKH